jgi:hypothetical protein
MQVDSPMHAPLEGRAVHYSGTDEAREIVF